MSKSKPILKDPHKDPPKVRIKLFWEWNKAAIDWEEHAIAVIQRVLEWGNSNDWNELIRFYGRERIIHSLKNEIPWFYERRINDICTYFKLEEKELKCYQLRESNQGL